MPEPARRAPFQIHLSTAIVLMFAAGGILWANVREWTYLSDRDIEYKFNGWPLAIYSHDAIPNRLGGPSWATQKILYAGIAANAITALILLFAVWLLCEWLIRRRAARKGA